LILKFKANVPFSAVLVGTNTQTHKHGLIIFNTIDHWLPPDCSSGNKCDVDRAAGGRIPTYNGLRGREVTLQEGAAMARQLSMDAGFPVPFIETSAVTTFNVSNAFTGTHLNHDCMPTGLTRRVLGVCVHWGGEHRAGTDGHA
jgi:hypothetical protein